jgi:hypothetical protein
MRQPAKLHYIGSVYKHHGLSYDAINPSWQLIRSIYIGGSNNPYPSIRRWAQASGDGPHSARQKLSFTLSNLNQHITTIACASLFSQIKQAH